MQTLDRLTALRKSASHRKISAETPFLVRQLSFRSLRGHASCEDYSPESHLLTHCWGLSMVSTQSYCFFSRGRSELDSTTAPVTPVVASTPSDVEVIDLTGLTDSSESDGERDIDEEEELEGSGSDDGSEGGFPFSFFWIFIHDKQRQCGFGRTEHLCISGQAMRGLIAYLGQRSWHAML